MAVVSIIVIVMQTVNIDSESFGLTYDVSTSDFIWLNIIVILMAGVSCLVLFVKRRSGFLNSDKVNQKYIDFTSQADDSTVRSYASNLSFFGKVFEPSKCLKWNEEDYINLMSSTDAVLCAEENDGCKNLDGLSCCMACGQFTQLVKMKHNLVKLEILCAEPSDDYSKALLGKLVYTFRGKCDIRFCDSNIRKKIHMYARIIKSDGSSPMIWHWKINKRGANKLIYSEVQSYIRPSGDTHHATEILGETLFYLVDELLWESSIIGKTEHELRARRNDWLATFYDMIKLDDAKTIYDI